MLPCWLVSNLLAVVRIVEVVLRGGVIGPRGSPPPPLSVAQAQKLVEGGVAAHPLDVAQGEPLGIGSPGSQGDGSSQSSARHIHRTGSVVEIGIVDEVGGNHRKIDHAQHGRIELHAVPGHLGVRGGRTPHRGRGQRGAAVGLDEHRAVLGEHLGQAVGNALAQGHGIERRLLGADILQHAAGRDPHRVDDDIPLLQLGPDRKARQQTPCQ